MTLKERNRILAKLLNESDNEIDLIISGYEKKLLKNYRAALKDIKQKIADIYEKYGDNVSYNYLQQRNRLKNLESQIFDRIKELTNQNISQTRSGIKEVFAENYYRTGFSLEKAARLKLGFGLLNNDVIDAAVFNPLDRIKWTERTRDNAQFFAKQIQQDLAQGLIKGDGYAKIARKVTEKTGFSANKAMRIIQTEGHRVQSAARQLSFQNIESIGTREELKIKRKWVATLDGRTRTSHRILDGKNPDKDGYYTFSDGVRTKGPGLSGVAEEDINCRCTEVSEFVDFPYQTRKDNISKEIIGYKNYGEWFKGRTN